MNTRKYKNVHAEMTRHGATVFYYRAKHGRRIRLPDPSSKGFPEAVRLAAIAGKETPRIARETKKDARRRAIGRALARCLNRAKYRYKGEKEECDIDLDWAIARAERQDFRCAITNIPFYLEVSSGRRNPYAPSLDRVDCARGYTKDNVRLVITAVNIMLQDWGTEVLERVAKAYCHILWHKSRTSIPAPLIRTPAPEIIKRKINEIEMGVA